MTTTTIAAALVNTLRTETGAPLMQCKAALLETGGDLSRATDVLRAQGVKATPVRQEGNHGYLAVYVHPGNQIVGLVELACATDFVARSEEFRAVASELAMQVAATAPLAVSIKALPVAVRDREKEVARLQVASDPAMASKPAALREDIATRKATKALEACRLLTQAYVRNPQITAGTLVDDLKLKVRESVSVRRIARWRVGESL